MVDLNENTNFEEVLDRICEQAEDAVSDGYNYIILSDRGVDKEKAAIPALIAVGAVHQHLVRKRVRAQVGLVLESGEPREVHHFALLFGYGVDCIYPYLVYELIENLINI